MVLPCGSLRQVKIAAVRTTVRMSGFGWTFRQKPAKGGLHGCWIAARREAATIATASFDLEGVQRPVHSSDKNAASSANGRGDEAMQERTGKFRHRPLPGNLTC
jgi:hypothetical protein